MGGPESSVKSKIFRIAIPLVVIAIIWVAPTPNGLSIQAWRMFAIFAATILGILLQPLPSGAIVLVGIAFSIYTKVLPEAKALSGFASSTVWLIFCAYVLSIGFVKTGLGRRIAYRLVSWVGGSSLGIAYALGVSDLIMAPAMPSVTARSGGIIFPIIRSINAAFGSAPGPTGKKIGNFLVMTGFQYAPVTGAMFLTGMAANPLCAELAKKTLKLEITWGGWALAALIPGLVCCVLTPLLLYWMIRPEMKRSETARELGREGLKKMGQMTGKEWLLSLVFVLALVGWGTSIYTQLGATTIGLGVVGLLFVGGVVGWRDVLLDLAAWDTVIWFGGIISLATGLADLGFIKWLVPLISKAFVGWAWVTTFVILGLIYIYIHYAFATASAHVAAIYPPFIAAAVAAGAPPMMVVICFGIFTNIMWGLTEYGGGPGPIYFSQGYYERPAFYRLNLAVTTMNVIIMFTVGLAWWKFIGLW